MATFRPISGWIAEPPPRRPALMGHRTADAAIVGGGFTGLTAALALRKQGMRVALIEREFAGFGASGRNAGHASPTIGKDLPSLITFFGLERAKQLLHFAETAVRHFESLIAEYQIQCDYVPSGNIIAAVHPSQEKKLRKAAAAGAKLGVEFEFLDSSALRTRGLPKAFICGVIEKCGGSLDPGKYVLGLRDAAIVAGVELYEGTAVTRIADAPKIRIETTGGSVEADCAVLATNAFTRSTGRLTRAQLPLTVTLLATEPLTAPQLQRIGWGNREGVYTAHEVLESYRWTADNRLIIGTKTVRQGFGARLAPEDHPPTALLLERTFRERFPELHDLEMAHYWSGHISLPLDFLPKFGVTGKFKNLYYGLGYAGHGLALASLAGTVLADLIAGRSTAADLLVNRFILPVPPEPLAWLYGRSLAGVLGLLDARLDRKVRQARR